MKKSFRELIGETFDCDFHGMYPFDLTLGLIRLELAVGKTRRKRRKVSAHRMVKLHEYLFHGEKEVWVELQFMQREVGTSSRWGLPPDEAIRLLTKKGLVVIDKWVQKDYVYSTTFEGNGVVEEVEYIVPRYSALVDPKSEGFKALFKAVAWSELGRWKGLSLGAIVANSSGTLLFDPYDDRGADIHSTSDEVIMDLEAKFHDWALDVFLA
jgi:hypothetical protein